MAHNTPVSNEAIPPQIGTLAHFGVFSDRRRAFYQSPCCGSVGLLKTNASAISNEISKHTKLVTINRPAMVFLMVFALL